MKWLNPGLHSLFDSYAGEDTKEDSEFDSGMSFTTSKNFFKTLPDNIQEIWVSFDFKFTAYSVGGMNTAYGSSWYFLNDANDTIVQLFLPNQYVFQMLVLDKDKKTLYTTEATKDFSVKHNIEIHIKTGENGRIDVWIDTKLWFSYRTPSNFIGNIKKFGLKQFDGVWNPTIKYSSFILQDTRRIGLEKFKKLTIDPDTEQNMPQGSTTTYKLSGLSDATEFSDITSVCAVLQATSRDANISTGTFSLEGADVGTIDVSDSSGKAYEIAHAETNSLTGKPWTRDDIEGKTLSFKVNGAS